MRKRDRVVRDRAEYEAATSKPVGSFKADTGVLFRGPPEPGAHMPQGA